MVSPSEEPSTRPPAISSELPTERTTHEVPVTLDLAASVTPLARQVIGAVRTRFHAITSSARVTLLNDRGLCAQPERDPEEWFSDRSRGGQSRLRDRREAARLCDGCPVVSECLEYAVATRQRYGVWGGMSERDRTVLTRATARTPRTVPPSRREPTEPSADESRISA
ncbi:hypothetical protein GCM10027053_17770 [Intrasporangium mesophilum]